MVLLLSGGLSVCFPLFVLRCVSRFALGDDVITQYIQGIQFLPVCIMVSRTLREEGMGNARPRP